MPTIHRGLSWLVHAYEKVQVELHGQYSADRQREFQAYYENTSLFHVACVLLLTPLPCLVIVTLADVPTLQEPTPLGFNANYVYWVRGGVLTSMMAAFSLILFKQYINVLELRPYQVVVVSVLTSLGVSVTTYNISKVVGFPLPFIVLCSGPPFQLIIILSGVVLWGKVFIRNPVARKKLPNAIGIALSQTCLMFVYPTYNSMYVTLQGLAQGAFVLLFPLIKILMMNLFARFCREMEDRRPEILVMNVEIFHALFSTYCMQGSTSPLTVAVIMGADALHVWLSLRDVNRQADRIARNNAESKLGPQLTPKIKPTSPMLRIQLWLLGRKNTRVSDSTALQHQNSSPTAEIIPSIGPPALKPGSVAPLQSQKTTRKGKASLRPALRAQKDRSQIEEKTRQLLHLAEFVILVEYVEMIVPLIYGIYVSICFHLPNRKFYPHLRSMNSEQLDAIVTNVLVYALLELVSLLLLSGLLRRKLRISPVYQLAFVLEKQWWLVQLKLTFWILYVVMGTLEHSGADYTLKFQWLRRGNTT
ncbi:hypothetical protein Poli38472_002105 [Pythium oligandrum]|uniref:Uncharacterized protein n=1 Tax=Pythium oligandrum TaxID=41045 RepID=A0A8K1FJI5_PYTOL|nr:hypothetical protein Poli38472_002105 [Pythium oligandrum]|eukprot:TMW63164.1 hypothetical protein Poli38472_002105 [Pythium oligandrum]